MRAKVKSKNFVVTTLLITICFALPVKAFNSEDISRLLDTNKCPRCDLSGANLKGADLSGADLSGADLSGADLSGAKLDNTTKLDGANLKGTIMPNGTIRN